MPRQPVATARVRVRVRRTGRLDRGSCVIERDDKRDDGIHSWESMRTWVVALVVGLAGCDQVFGVTRPGDGGGGSGDAPVSSCTMPAFFDRFETTSPCSSWGFPGGVNRTLTQGAGNLTITVAANTTGNGSCSNGAEVAFEPGGVFVEIGAFDNPGGSYAFLAIEWMGTPQRIRRIGANGEGLVFESEAGRIDRMDYDPDVMRWWRLRPVPGEIVAEFSSDGRAWIELARSTVDVPATIQPHLNAGVFTPAPGAAAWRTVFEGLNVCPPSP